MRQRIKLKNLSCQKCIKHVSDHLFALDGIEEVKIQLEEQIAEINTGVAYKLEEYQGALVNTIYEVEELL